MENLFLDAIQKKNYNRPPVWFMRQAGRYHAHYQALRKNHTFIDLCKKPDVACEATMGPIREFDFDAAILFSDLLFPLEVMGMGLRYEEGPKLDWHLKTKDELTQLKGGAELSELLSYQYRALEKIRAELSPTKGLLGFVGGPLTLFFYAVSGSHMGDLSDARSAIENAAKDGRFEGFCEKLIDLLAHNMAKQARAGADTVAVLDTCAGEIDSDLYGAVVVPVLKELFSKFKTLCPNTPIAYYSKKTGPAHWNYLKDLPISYKGIDWNHPIDEVLVKWSDCWVIQGNVDPNWLFLEPLELETRLRAVFGKVKALDAKYRRGWICGLGHGVLPKTPESNVKLFLRLQKEVFG